MQISVTFRNMEPSEHLKEYATEKCLRLKKYISLPADVHVVLAKHKYRHHAEIKVSKAGVIMKGEENSEDMYSSIDLAMDKIERQARRFKDKRREHRGGEGGEITVRHAVMESPADSQGGAVVVDSEELSPKPMSVDEAIMQMEAQSRDFFVFLNAGSNEVNVIYRRHDGSVGLIEARPAED
ncbi:MAG: ribosome-associated translation inhibitor RaiA [Deltaproteobacteria bacterium]|nr:MAG: ribosome-associated translation inhibitor RaiA [Deltaproteobacteria bacterium]